MMATAASTASPSHAAPRATVSAVLDLTSSPTPFPHYWKNSFGSGHTMLGTRADWREHMARSAAEIGVRGLRMHGVMDDDLSICPRKGEYHFYSLDLVRSSPPLLLLRGSPALSGAPQQPDSDRCAGAGVRQHASTRCQTHRRAEVMGSRPAACLPWARVLTPRPLLVPQLHAESARDLRRQGRARVQLVLRRTGLLPRPQPPA
jgi:hypothetical protein